MGEYSHRLIPNGCEILGLSLKPLTLGHVFLMERENCALVKEGAEAGINDLILALCICSRSYGDFLEFLDDDKAQEWCTKWGNAVVQMIDDEAAKDTNEFTSPEWKRFMVYKRVIKEECKRMVDYMKQGIKEPFHVKENERDKWVGNSASNPYQNLRYLLITELGYSADTVMDVPLASAIADYYKYLETTGQITIYGW